MAPLVTVADAVAVAVKGSVAVNVPGGGGRVTVAVAVGVAVKGSSAVELPGGGGGGGGGGVVPLAAVLPPMGKRGEVTAGQPTG